MDWKDFNECVFFLSIYKSINKMHLYILRYKARFLSILTDFFFIENNATEN